ncbi:MAG: hypothetical protein JXR95_12240 [Deltaproteobacteria bacterium]|nr:hypothetical protein [Deltaproteobacteria bacterium]
MLILENEIMDDICIKFESEVNETGTDTLSTELMEHQKKCSRCGRYFETVKHLEEAMKYEVPLRKEPSEVAARVIEMMKTRVSINWQLPLVSFSLSVSILMFYIWGVFSPVNLVTDPGNNNNTEKTYLTFQAVPVSSENIKVPGNFSPYKSLAQVLKKDEGIK